MRGIVLACGTDISGIPGLDASGVVEVARRPGRSDVDPVLARIEPRGASGPGADLIVAGDDADLAAVVLRLLRRDRLAEVSVGYLPARGSVVASSWSLPSDRADAYRLASTGEVARVTLVRDDAGGVLLGKGTLNQVNGIAYGDDEVALRGRARRIEVTPDGPDGLGLVVRVQKGWRAGSARTLRSRAFQLGSDPIFPILDGVRRERSTERWTWYRHTEDLLVVRPAHRVGQAATG